MRSRAGLTLSLTLTLTRTLSRTLTLTLTLAVTLTLTLPSCEDELRRPELGAVVAGMDILLSDVGFKVRARVTVRVKVRVRVLYRHHTHIATVSRAIIPLTLTPILIQP